MSARSLPWLIALLLPALALATSEDFPLSWKDGSGKQIHWTERFGEYIVFDAMLPRGCALSRDRLVVSPADDGSVSFALPFAPPQGATKLELACPDDDGWTLEMRYHWLTKSPFFTVKIQDGGGEFPLTLEKSTASSIPLAGNAELSWIATPHEPKELRRFSVSAGFGSLAVSQTGFLALSSIDLRASAAYVFPRWQKWEPRLQFNAGVQPLHTTGASSRVTPLEGEASVAHPFWEGHGWQARFWGGVHWLDILSGEADSGFGKVYGVFVGPQWRGKLSQTMRLELEGSFGIYNGDGSLPSFDSRLLRLSARLLFGPESRWFTRLTFESGTLRYATGEAALSQETLELGFAF